jgi:hypothetical protein
MKLKMLLAYVLIFASAAFAQTEPYNDAKLTIASSAYGFCWGQELSLLNIGKTYPDLKPKATAAQNAFNANFGTTKASIETYLKNSMGDTAFNTFNKQLKADIASMVDSQNTTKAEAVEFIKTVENRAKGDITSPYLENFLMFKYAANPVGEFNAGQTYTFNTSDEAYAKNSKWTVKIPKSWTAEESSSPEIIKQFKSDCGSGSQLIMLLAIELPYDDTYVMTQEEIDATFNEDQAKTMVPEGARFVSFSKIVVDGISGGMLEVEQDVEGMGVPVTIRLAQFMVIKGKYMYCVQGAVSGDAPGAKITADMKKYMPLFKAVATSVDILP